MAAQVARGRLKCCAPLFRTLGKQSQCGGLLAPAACTPQSESPLALSGRAGLMSVRPLCGSDGCPGGPRRAKVKWAWLDHSTFGKQSQCGGLLASAACTPQSESPLVLSASAGLMSVRPLCGSDGCPGGERKTKVLCAALPHFGETESVWGPARPRCLHPTE